MASLKFPTIGIYWIFNFGKDMSFFELEIRTRTLIIE